MREKHVPKVEEVEKVPVFLTGEHYTYVGLILAAKSIRTFCVRAVYVGEEAGKDWRSVPVHPLIFLFLFFNFRIAVK